MNKCRAFVACSCHSFANFKKMCLFVVVFCFFTAVYSVVSERAVSCFSEPFQTSPKSIWYSSFSLQLHSTAHLLLMLVTTCLLRPHYFSPLNKVIGNLYRKSICTCLLGVSGIYWQVRLYLPQPEMWQMPEVQAIAVLLKFWLVAVSVNKAGFLWPQ